MRLLSLSRAQRLGLIIGISASFFIVEITLGFKTKSLALVADAFHVSFDLISFVIALLAVQTGDRVDRPRSLSYGWQRAQIVGAFFNGVFLLALGVSIVLQSIERFISPQRVQQPKQVLIVGCVGLALNIVSALTIHEHSHAHPPSHDDRPLHDLNDPHAGHDHALHKSHQHPGRHHMDLGIVGVGLHLLGDAINNLFVILSAVVLIKTGFVYADPIASTLVGIMILASSIPLVRRSARVLLEGAPVEIDLKGVERDVKRVAGVRGVHEMHVWSLTQSKTIATIHVATADDSLSQFMRAAREISECLHHWNIHAVTIQPELVPPSYVSRQPSTDRLETSQCTTPLPEYGGGSQSTEYNQCRLRCVGTNALTGCESGACCD